MKQQDLKTQRVISRLVPRETVNFDVRSVSPIAIINDVMNDDTVQGDLNCAGLEDLSRHLKWLDDNYCSGQYDRLETRARDIVVLADQLGLRLVGQVAADVAYCIDANDEIALSATLSRLMRLVTQALDHAAGPVSGF